MSKHQPPSSKLQRNTNSQAPNWLQGNGTRADSRNAISGARTPSSACSKRSRGKLADEGVRAPFLNPPFYRDALEIWRLELLCPESFRGWILVLGVSNCALPPHASRSPHQESLG